MSGVYPLNEYQTKVHDIKRKYAFEYADSTIKELAKMVAMVAEKLGDGTVGATSDTVKGMDRATEKVMESAETGGYGGDWWLIKDLARCTFVVRSDARGWFAYDEIINRYFVPSNGWSVVEKKPKASMPKGYSDWKVIVSRGGSIAEIQINTTNLIYAKDMEFFMKVCPGQYAQMRANYGMVPGGLGHKIYEVARSNKAREAEAKAAGIAYYDYFRTPTTMTGWKARDAVSRMNLNLAHMHV